MPRKPRNFVPDLAYHLTSRGNGKQQIFFSPADYDAYLLLLDKYLKDSSVVLYHYCLMPNHIHLLVGQASSKISKIMQYTQRDYTRYFQRIYDRVGHVWQKRFYDRAITNSASLIACGNYIELNPTRAELVANPEDWLYSSYHHYAGQHIDGLVTDDPLYVDLGQTPSVRQANYVSRTIHALKARTIPSALMTSAEKRRVTPSLRRVAPGDR